MNQCCPASILIQPAHQVSQCQLGDINALKLQARLLNQPNQFRDQNFPGRDYVNQLTSPTGCVPGKGKHIGNGFGRTEVQKIFQLPLESIAQFRFIDAFRAIHLEHLILVQRQHKRRRCAGPTFTFHQCGEGFQTSGRQTIAKARSPCFRPG